MYSSETTEWDEAEEYQWFCACGASCNEGRRYPERKALMLGRKHVRSSGDEECEVWVAQAEVRELLRPEAIEKIAAGELTLEEANGDGQAEPE